MTNPQTPFSPANFIAAEQATHGPSHEPSQQNESTQ
jgi:hypothetical protein